MRRGIVALIAVVMLVGLLPAAVHADKPLDVNCDVLESAITATDGFLDAGGVQFKSLGQLTSTLKKDPALFGQLSALIYAFSGNTITFTTVSEAVTTTAKCGLIPHLIAQIND